MSRWGRRHRRHQPLGSARPVSASGRSAPSRPDTGALPLSLSRSDHGDHWDFPAALDGYDYRPLKENEEAYSRTLETRPRWLTF